MKGTFENKEACVSELKNQGFIWYAEDVYIKKSVKEVAEVFVYSDNSASALIGKYTDIK